MGKYNGFGGKVEQKDASIRDAAIRELHEEAGIVGKRVEKCAVLWFEFDRQQLLYEVHVFRAYAHSGNVMESEEMRPQWFPIDSVPFTQMWKDDIYWFPYLLNPACFFRGYFLFRGHDTLLGHVIQPLPGLSTKSGLDTGYTASFLSENDERYRWHILTHRLNARLNQQRAFISDGQAWELYDSKGVSISSAPARPLSAQTNNVNSGTIINNVDQLTHVR